MFPEFRLDIQPKLSRKTIRMSPISLFGCVSDLVRPIVTNAPVPNSRATVRQLASRAHDVNEMVIDNLGAPRWWAASRVRVDDTI